MAELSESSEALISPPGHEVIVPGGLTYADPILHDRTRQSFLADRWTAPIEVKDSGDTLPFAAEKLIFGRQRLNHHAKRLFPCNIAAPGCTGIPFGTPTKAVCKVIRPAI